ncbi:MAG: ATP-binding protein [Campylobacterales bacterium]|nr:ATP-binding protein [Campylobacterales bacterium]
MLNYFNTINKKIMALQAASLTFALGIIVFVGMNMVQSYFISIHEKYLDYVSNDVNKDIKQNIQFIQQNLFYISNSKKQIVFSKKSKHKNIHKDFLLKYKNIVNEINYYDANGKNTKSILNNKLIKNHNKKINKDLYNRILINPNKILNSEILYDERNDKFNVLFAINKESTSIVELVIDIKNIIELKDLNADDNLILRIVNRKGIIQYSSNKNEIKQKINFLENFHLNKNKLINININNKKNRAYIKPIFNNKSYLFVSYNNNNFDQLGLNQLKLAIFVFLFIFIITSLIVYRLSLSITKPFNILVKGINSISQRKYANKIIIKSNDEIELLAKEFNEMANKIYLSNLEIDKKNIELNEKNLLLEEFNQKLSASVENEISKNVKKDELLRQQAGLAQMGEMISMIAHQWRQPLSAIGTAIIGIQVKLAMNKYNFNDKKDRNDFLEILNEKHNSVNEYVQFLSSTIDDFRDFFKPDKEKELVLLSDVIKQTLRIVEPSMLNKEIKINTYFDNDSKILLYKNELIQVILNILKNSEDNFSLQNIENKVININTKLLNETYIISISDNGGGIKASILDKIFNPYFSTKKEMNGTGLGLYMSKIMIEEHNNGALNVHNINNGICFEILFNKE